jgi:hypothetical protein
MLSWLSWVALVVAALAAAAALLSRWAINAESLGARDAGLALSLSFLLAAITVASLYAGPALGLAGLAVMLRQRAAGLRLLAAAALALAPLVAFTLLG